MLGAGRSYVTPRGHVTPEVTLKAWPFPSRKYKGWQGKGSSLPSISHSLSMTMRCRKKIRCRGAEPRQVFLSARL